MESGSYGHEQVSSRVTYSRAVYWLAAGWGATYPWVTSQSGNSATDGNTAAGPASSRVLAVWSPRQRQSSGRSTLHPSATSCTVSPPSTPGHRQNLAAPDPPDSLAAAGPAACKHDGAYAAAVDRRRSFSARDVVHRPPLSSRNGRQWPASPPTGNAAQAMNTPVAEEPKSGSSARHLAEPFDITQSWTVKCSRRRCAVCSKASPVKPP